MTPSLPTALMILSNGQDRWSRSSRWSTSWRDLGHAISANGQHRRSACATMSLCDFGQLANCQRRLRRRQFGGRTFIYRRHRSCSRLAEISRCKRKRLDQYAEQQPTRFIEYDGFDVGVDCLDYVRRPDPGGHWLSSCETVELMSGMTVRVLINPKTPRTTGHCAAAQDS
jgi:hypothetical protein